MRRAAPPRVCAAAGQRRGRACTLVRLARGERVACCARPAGGQTGRARGALIISSTVCAVGAFRLTSMARMPKRMIWMVAPAAYQNGPDTPYLYATLELCSSVAAHVLHRQHARAQTPAPAHFRAAA